MRNILSGRGSFPLKEIDDDKRQEDNAWHLELVKKKSANMQSSKVRSMVHDEMVRGFSLPLPTSAITNLLRCSLTPFGMVDQGSIDDMDRLVEKLGLAHDLSFKGSSGMSVNFRVIGCFLLACIFGFVLRHMIQFIVGCCLHFPGKRVMIGKGDMNTAYRRDHL
jgi:hypothetical protein